MLVRDTTGMASSVGRAHVDGGGGSAWCSRSAAPHRLRRLSWSTRVGFGLDLDGHVVVERQQLVIVDRIAGCDRPGDRLSRSCAIGASGIGSSIAGTGAFEVGWARRIQSGRPSPRDRACLARLVDDDPGNRAALERRRRGAATAAVVDRLGDHVVDDDCRFRRPRRRARRRDRLGTAARRRAARRTRRRSRPRRRRRSRARRRADRARHVRVELAGVVVVNRTRRRGPHPRCRHRDGRSSSTTSPSAISIGTSSSIGIASSSSIGSPSAISPSILPTSSCVDIVRLSMYSSACVFKLRCFAKPPAARCGREDDRHLRRARPSCTSRTRESRPSSWPRRSRARSARARRAVASAIACSDSGSVITATR